MDQKTLVIHQHRQHHQHRHLQHETDNLKTFNHDYIVKCYGTTTIYDQNNVLRFGIVMEFADSSLVKVIPELDESAKIQAIFHVALAMLELEKHHVVHGDLRSCNVLIFGVINSPSMIAKICDFGFAKTSTEELHLPKICAPPETLLANISNRYKYDVFSFGVLVSEILTGKHPLRNGDHHLNDLELKALYSSKYYSCETTFAQNVPDNFKNFRSLISACCSEMQKRPNFLEVLESNSLSTKWKEYKDELAKKQAEAQQKKPPLTKDEISTLLKKTEKLTMAATEIVKSVENFLPQTASPVTPAQSAANPVQAANAQVQNLKNLKRNFKL